MSSFASLEIGKRALQAQNYAIDVMSNNIANADTEGYSRRQALTTEALQFQKFGFNCGTGVDMQSLRSFRQQFYDKEIRKASSTLAGLDADVLFYNNAEVIFQEPKETNIGQMLNKFLYYFDELALQPESLGLRENLLFTTQTMVERLNNASTDLLEMRRQANTDLINQTDEANKLIQVIADCNKAIAISKDKSGNDSLTYIDKREVAIEKLSKLCNVSASYENTGLANVFINGIDVVTGPSMQMLKVVEEINPATGESSLNVVTYNERKDLTVNVNPISGQMAAAAKQYNVLLDPIDSTGAFSIMQTLDNFANGIATNINALFQTGYGLNDTDAAPVGRVLFESTNGDPITAGNIQLANLTAADVPLSSTAGAAGNSVIAQEVSRLLQNQNFLESQTPMEFYSNFIGRISQHANEAVSSQNSAKLVVESLSSTRDSIMGVNVDEEAINMIKYQKNLEAASRVIDTTNQILSTIINLGRN